MPSWVLGAGVWMRKHWRQISILMIGVLVGYALFKKKTVPSVASGVAVYKARRRAQKAAELQGQVQRGLIEEAADAKQVEALERDIQSIENADTLRRKRIQGLTHAQLNDELDRLGY